MLSNPLRDIGRRIHCALLQGEFRGKRQVPFLAGIRRQDGTDRNDQLDRIHAGTLRPIFMIGSTTSYEAGWRKVSAVH